MGYNYGIMLKSLAVFAVLFSVTHALVPVFGQTANNPAGASGGVQQQGRNSNPPPPPAPPLANQDQPPTAKGNAGEQGGQNKGDTVTVGKLPPCLYRRIRPTGVIGDSVASSLP